MWTVSHLESIGLLRIATTPPPGMPEIPTGPDFTEAVPKQRPQNKSETNGKPNDASHEQVVFVEKSAGELAKMGKDERKAYHAARIAAAKSGSGSAAPKPTQLSKVERRALQEAQRKVKEDSKGQVGEHEQLVKDLKMQGLNEDQARMVVAEMARGNVAADEGDSDSEVEEETLRTSIVRWMSEQEQNIPADILHDFNMKVRFQGHVDTTPPDHLRALLQILVEEACKDVDLSVGKLQPTVVAKPAEKQFKRWCPLLTSLEKKIADCLVTADIIKDAILQGTSTHGASEGVNSAFVGCIMGLREADVIEDDELLTACKRVEGPSKVLQKYIEFLQEEVEDDSGSEDE